MGTKRVGLARVEALIENLKRELELTGATLSGGIVKGLTSLATSVQSVAAAGNSQGTAAAVAATSPIVLVTGLAGGSEAVKLPALSAVETGAVFFVGTSSSTQAMKIYPNTDDKFAHKADNAGITVVAGGGAVCAKIDATQWIIIETPQAD